MYVLRSVSEQRVGFTSVCLFYRAVKFSFLHYSRRTVLPRTFQVSVAVERKPLVSERSLFTSLSYRTSVSSLLPDFCLLTSTGLLYLHSRFELEDFVWRT
jgi:hypothetical protein